MEQIKSLIPFAKWLLRICLALLVYTIYFDVLLDFTLTSADWFVSVLIIIFTVLIFFGGFLKKAKLTVVSGMVIFILSALMIILQGPNLESLAHHIAPASIGFYFMARGNKG